MAPENSQRPSQHFVRRMRRSQRQQLLIAIVSVLLAGLGVGLLSPEMVGVIPFYCIIGLLILNAILALQLYRKVLYPLEELLVRLDEIATHIAKGDLSLPKRICHNRQSIFASLGAGMDSVIETLIERIRLADNVANRTLEILQMLPIGLVLLSRTGKVIRIVNEPEYHPLVGLEPGHFPDELIWGRENIDACHAALQRAFAEKGTIWLEFETHDPKGGETHYRASLRAVNTYSALLGLQDMRMADLKRDEQKRQQTLPQTGIGTYSRSSVRRMAASIAHDAKNVFTALSNLAEINKNSADPAVRSQIPIVEDAIRRGKGLMTELTTFAGVTKVTLTCVPAAKSFLELVKSPTIHALIPENILTSIEVSGDKLPDIDLDMEQIWKIPFNLAKNAVEAIGQANGRISFIATPYEMTEENANQFRHAPTLQMGKGVLFSICDDGPGIPDEIQQRIFEPYFSSKGEGRGIGLMTVFSLLDAHGGAIRLISNRGCKTCFECFFPASRLAREELEMVHEVAPNGEILLVDDDPAILHTTALLLKTMKVAAHAASTAEDALRKMRTLRSRIKAILLDAHLNSATSAGLLRNLKAEFPKAPVILTSGANEDSLLAPFRGATYDAFLPKPFSVAELKAALAKVTAPQPADK